MFARFAILFALALYAAGSAFAFELWSDNRISVSTDGSNWCDSSARLSVKSTNPSVKVETLTNSDQVNLLGTVMLLCPSAQTVLIGGQKLKVSEAELVRLASSSEPLPINATQSENSEPIASSVRESVNQRQQPVIDLPKSDNPKISQPENVYLKGPYTLINLGVDTRYNYGDEKKYIEPDWYLLRNINGEYEVIDSKSPSCRGRLIQTGINNVSPHGWTSDMPNGDAGQYFSADVPRPSEVYAYNTPPGCAPVSIVLKSEDRARSGWKLLAQVITPYQQFNGQTGYVNRHGRIEYINASSSIQAIELGRASVKSLLRKYNSRFADSVFQDPSDMVLFEYADWIGRKPNEKVAGISMFDFGWFTVYRPGSKEPTIKVRGDDFSAVRRVGEAVVFDGLERGKVVATYVVAPYPYGVSSGSILTNAILDTVTGTDFSELSKGSFPKRQIEVCTETAGLLGTSHYVKYEGAKSIFEAFIGPCNLATPGAIRTSLGFMEEGGQTANPDRRGILYSGPTNGLTTWNQFPCGREPEFTISSGVMRLRGGNDDPNCDRPSDAMDSLSTERWGNKSRRPADPAIIVPSN